MAVYAPTFGEESNHSNDATLPAVVIPCLHSAISGKAKGSMATRLLSTSSNVGQMRWYIIYE